VKREVGVPDREVGGSRWSLDHLFIDQKAVPTLVEVKKATTPGSAARWSARCSTTPLTAWSSGQPSGCARTSRPGARGIQKDADEVFRDSLGGDADQERFWVEVEQNLRGACPAGVRF